MSVTNSLKEVEAFLHAQIPLAKAMGVQVDAYNEEHLILTAPLEPNHNHLGTAFGGSLSAMATLAGYSLLWMALGERDSHIVIRDGSIHYRHPVTSEIRAICRRPEPVTLARFRKHFERSGKARIRLTVHIEQEGRVCVEFTGMYVAMK